mmetsp:Transcript_28724/g.82172  ORF Transcript_28724/g.82172 Transcript_28724/m.82172 type:complete len:187 (+) Transcript_28724:1-561(+)
MFSMGALRGAARVYDADNAIKVSMRARSSQLRADADRERLCNDVLNTSVMAALVGGFAFSNLQELHSPLKQDEPRPIDIAIYMFNVIAVHASTCSCLASAFLYRVINRLRDDAVSTWAADMPWKMLLPMPLAKFGMGCVFYLVSVILLSFRDLEYTGVWRYAALAIGVGSVMMVFCTASIVFYLKG